MSDNETPPSGPAADRLYNGNDGSMVTPEQAAESHRRLNDPEPVPLVPIDEYEAKS